MAEVDGPQQKSYTANRGMEPQGWKPHGQRRGCKNHSQLVLEARTSAISTSLEWRPMRNTVSCPCNLRTASSPSCRALPRGIDCEMLSPLSRSSPCLASFLPPCPRAVLLSPSLHSRLGFWETQVLSVPQYLRNPSPGGISVVCVGCLNVSFPEPITKHAQPLATIPDAMAAKENQSPINAHRMQVPQLTAIGMTAKTKSGIVDFVWLFRQLDDRECRRVRMPSRDGMVAFGPLARHSQSSESEILLYSTGLRPPRGLGKLVARSRSALSTECFFDWGGGLPCSRLPRQTLS
ncbi:hypothetical protein LXA43DRAFT_986001 [Ganoderma leucocontextum]|nr:hypothetical protein LXA43DRAFT_986001 [Ganoderma leucocontextum]